MPVRTVVYCLDELPAATLRGINPKRLKNEKNLKYMDWFINSSFIDNDSAHWKISERISG